MSATLQTRATAASAKPTFTPSRFGVVQRKCDCGGSAGMSGECEECQEKQLTINRYSTDRRSPSGLLPSRAGLARSAPPAGAGSAAQASAGRHFGHLRVGGGGPGAAGGERLISRPGDRSEEEADRAAERVMRALSSPVLEEKQEAPALSQTPPLIQRAAADENAAEMGAKGEATTAPEAATPEETAARGLIVDDDAQEVGPDQMRKSEFLGELRAAVCAAADAELAAAGRSTEGCPYIERAFERYRNFSGAQLERGLRRYAPEAAGATSARGYMPAVSERVRQAVATWAVTGQITGVPEELASELPGTGLLGAFGGLLSGIGGVLSGFAGGIGGGGGILFKARDGAAKDADPEEVRAQLGTGRPLDGVVRARMEPAFGYDFSRVRVHTDARAAELSASLNARAFTIGADIAFGAKEYQPGTPTGDALIAHELAHVAQQGGGASSAGPLRQGGTEYTTLEEDADASAVSAVVSIWSGVKHGAANIARRAMPRLKSGLGLQRCRTTQGQQRQTQTPGAATSGQRGGQTQAAPVPLPNQILNEVNAQRGDLGALRWNDTLARSAATYCGVMTRTNVFSHRADGSDPLGRVSAAGYFPLGGGGVAGENLYQNPQDFTANDAVTWWMGSPPHRAEIMRPNYEEAGVAVCAGTVNIERRPRHTNIAVIHFGASHPVLTVGNPAGSPTTGNGARWTITGSASDNIDPPGAITVRVSLIRARGGMTVTGLPAGPLILDAGGNFSFTFDTAGKGSAEIRIEATDAHGNAPRPETRTVRVNR